MSRGIVIMQWYRMKRQYFEGITCKAHFFYCDRLKAIAFKQLKKNLILKFKGMHLCNVHSLRALARTLYLWKTAYLRKIEHS